MPTSPLESMRLFLLSHKRMYVMFGLDAQNNFMCSIRPLNAHNTPCPSFTACGGRDSSLRTLWINALCDLEEWEDQNDVELDSHPDEHTDNDHSAQHERSTLSYSDLLRITHHLSLAVTPKIDFSVEDSQKGLLKKAYHETIRSVKNALDILSNIVFSDED